MNSNSSERLPYDEQRYSEKTSNESPAILIHEESALSAPKIPNGGFVAWLHVAGAFCIILNTWGLINAYGAYQTFYQGNILSSESESNISWIGSIQAFLLNVTGLIAGPIFDAGYLRSLIWTGSILSVLGVMLTSISKTYWQVLLSQGLLVGLGTGCMFVAAISIIAQYFTTKKILAYGIASTGSSIGGVLYSILFSRLQPNLGSGWTTRVIGFVVLALFVLPLLFMKQKIRPATRREIFNTASFRDIPYLVFNIGVFFGFMGIYIPFYYVQLHALEVCNVKEGFSIYLLAIINASSTVGRVLPNVFADKIGPLNLQIPLTFIVGILCFGWIAVKDTPGLIAWCVIYGFFCGCFASVPSASVMSLTNDLRTLGSRMGISVAASGFGVLIGSPIAGALLRSRGGWTSLQAWAGLLLVLSGIFSIAARILKVGLKYRTRI